MLEVLSIYLQRKLESDREENMLIFALCTKATRGFL